MAIAFKDVTPEHAARELAEAGLRRAEAAQRRHVLLARVSALMSARLVQAQRPRDLVRLLVPGLADLGSVALLDESGVLRRVAEAASDPEAAAALRGLEREALLPGLLPPASEVLHGSSKLRLDERIAQARARLQGDESAAATRLRRVSPTQGLLVPLRTRGRVIGVLTLGMIAASGRCFGAEDEAHLVKWLSKRLGTPIRPPDLSPDGFRLIGGRLLPGETSPAALLMYEDVLGRRLALYVTRREGGETELAFAEEPGRRAFWWIEEGLGCALVGDLPRDALRRLAISAYHGLTEA